jgi:hypothetical protein
VLPAQSRSGVTSGEHSKNATFERLEALDARLLTVERRTLDPARPRATALATVARAVALPDDAASAWADGMIATAEAILTHFPENLFWDLDYLGASVAREALRDRPRAAEHVRASFVEIVGLHALFGRGTSIRFRYVHDFVYGFDWAKWVRRAPSARAHVGPFDVTFLRAMRARGTELMALIEADDAKYPRLEGTRPRNPFPFSREPDAELALYTDLARSGLVPVRAWTIDTPPVWDAPFQEEREARARALGLV